MKITAATSICCRGYEATCAKAGRFPRGTGKVRRYRKGLRGRADRPETQTRAIRASQGFGVDFELALFGECPIILGLLPSVGLGEPTFLPSAKRQHLVPTMRTRQSRSLSAPGTVGGPEKAVALLKRILNGLRRGKNKIDRLSSHLDANILHQSGTDICSAEHEGSTCMLRCAYGFNSNWLQAPQFYQVFFDMVGSRPCVFDLDS